MSCLVLQFFFLKRTSINVHCKKYPGTQAFSSHFMLPNAILISPTPNQFSSKKYFNNDFFSMIFRLYISQKTLSANKNIAKIHKEISARQDEKKTRFFSSSKYALKSRYHKGSFFDTR